MLAQMLREFQPTSSNNFRNLDNPLGIFFAALMTAAVLRPKVP
jgi:hypothetical protein